MKKILDIHNSLSNKTHLSIIWLLYKYGDLPVRDVINLFADSTTKFTYFTNHLSDIGLIELVRDDKDGRQKIMRLKKDFASIYSYTLFVISDDPEMVEFDKKFLAGRGR